MWDLGYETDGFEMRRRLIEESGRSKHNMFTSSTLSLTRRP